MSIDLSRYDIYNYEFYLRPNGQSVKPTFGNLSTITDVSDASMCLTSLIIIY